MRSAPSESAFDNHLLPLQRDVVASFEDARSLLRNASNSDGTLTTSSLLTYLRSQGISASDIEAEEMIRMLEETAPGHASAAHLEIPQRNTVLETRSTIATSIDACPSITDDLWQIWLNRSFVVGEAACRAGLLDREAIEQREPFIFIALPSLTFMDILSNSPLGFLNFSRTVRISQENTPSDWAIAVTYLFEAQSMFRWEVDVDDTFLVRLRLSVVADPLDGLDDGLSDRTLSQVRGLLQSSSTALSQTALFRENFECVLRLIEEVTA